MATIIADDLVSIARIQAAGKSAKVEVKLLSPKDTGAAKFDDNLYIIDYVHPYGISTARRIRETNPAARVIGFYPHIRFYVKDEVERIGCRAFTNSEFFAKAKDIISGKM